MANIKTFFLAMVLCLFGITFAAPRAHIGMINDINVQDVGAVYPFANYGGTSTYLLMTKQQPQCMQLYASSVPSFFN
jgi:hypothetical protein